MRLKPIALALIALILGYSGYWFVIASNVDVFLEKIQPEMKANGLEFVYQDYKISGFPYRLEVNFADPSLRFENGPLVAQVEAGNLQAIVQPWKLDHFILILEGSQTHIFYDSQKPNEFVADPAILRLSFSRNGPAGYRLSVEMNNVDLQTTLEMDLPETYETVALHLRKNKISANSDQALLEPELLDITLSMTVQEGKTFDTEASFRGMDVPVLDYPSLMAWRDNGGTLEIEKLAFQSEGRIVEANGSFTLDDQLRPLGTMGIEAESAKDIVSLLQAGRFVSADEAFLLATAIEALPLPEDTPLPVVVSITIQNGVASLGPLALFEAGPVIKQ